MSSLIYFRSQLFLEHYWLLIQVCQNLARNNFVLQITLRSHFDIYKIINNIWCYTFLERRSGSADNLGKFDQILHLDILHHVRHHLRRKHIMFSETILSSNPTKARAQLCQKQIIGSHRMFYLRVWKLRIYLQIGFKIWECTFR